MIEIEAIDGVNVKDMKEELQSVPEYIFHTHHVIVVNEKPKRKFNLDAFLDLIWLIVMLGSTGAMIFVAFAMLSLN